MKAKIVVLETTQGIIKLKLFPHIAPQACFNFMELIKQGIYDNTIFHRVIPNFMIQGGWLEGITSVFGKSFPDEINSLYNFARPGVLAMANCGPNTNGSQFFITMAHTEWLDGHHTIFGEVFAGYKILWLIARGPRDKNDKPLEDQKIIRAYIEELEDKQNA